MVATVPLLGTAAAKAPFSSSRTSSSTTTISSRLDNNSSHSSCSSSSSSSSSYWVSILIFTGTVVVSNLLARHLINEIKQQHQQQQQQQRRQRQRSSSDDLGNEASISRTTTMTTKVLSKRSVLALRQQYFSKSVSVSYLNSGGAGGGGGGGGLMIMEGNGTRLYDEQSISYLDTRNNVCHVGHCHPKVVDAISRQVSQLNTNTRYLHPNAVMLAERIVKLLNMTTKPSLSSSSSSVSESKLQVVFLVNSGSEANDLALRLARAHTQSNNTIVVEGGYHGHTLEVLKVSPYKFSKGTEFPLQQYHHEHIDDSQKEEEHSTRHNLLHNHTNTSFPTPSHNIYQVPVPDMYRGRHRYRRRRRRQQRRDDGGTSTSTVHVNEDEDKGRTRSSSSSSRESAFVKKEREVLGERYAQYVVDSCEYYRSEHNENVGALILEGGMSVGGVILPPRSYFRRAVTAVRQAGGVWIADEVQTGFGRLGPNSSFWAFSHSLSSDNDDDDDVEDNDINGNKTKYPVRDVFPDIVTMGKPMGNGMSIGAVVTTREIAESFEQLGIEYFNTFGGNPVACAASLAMLDVLENDNLPQHASDVGTYLRHQFEDLDCPWIGDIRGSGLFIGIELVRPGTFDSSIKVCDDNEILPPEPATAETSFVCTLLKDKYHILTSIDGLYDNVLVVKPPLVFSYEDVDLFVNSFRLSIEELERLDDNELKRLGKTPT